MFTKETPRRAQTRQTRPFLPLRRLSGPLLRLGIAALLTQALLPGGCRPFALGFAAASGAGWNGFAALWGILLSALSGHPAGGAFRYAAAALLLYSVLFACYDLPLYEKKAFLPLCCGLSAAVTGLIYGFGTGWSGGAVLSYATETLLSGLSCVLFQRLEGRRPAGLLWLSLGVTVFAGNLSPTAGAATAALLTLLAAGSGPGQGAVTGGLLGFGTGLVTGGYPALGGVLCCCGGLSGLIAPLSRLGMVAVYPAAFLMLCRWSGVSLPAALPCAAAVAVSALPVGLLTRLEEQWSLRPRSASAVSPYSAEAVRYQLEEQSTAFRTLYERICGSVERGEPPEDASVIIDRTAERLCQSCARRPLCWEQDHLSTARVMNQVLSAALERGNALAGDFGSFRRQCLRREELVQTFNEELYRFWNRRQYRARMKNNRLAVCRQYAQLSGLLSSAAEELARPVTADHIAAARVEEAAAGLGMTIRSWVWKDSRGRRTLEIRGKGLEKLNAPPWIRAFSSAMEAEMEPEDVFRTPRGQRLILRQKPPLTVKAAVASRQKEEDQPNGDNGVWFRDGSGILWAILCDGMGSGEGAAGESRLLMSLLKDFLHAGIGPRAALTTLTGAMSLRGEVEGGFTTVDLLKIDLFSGSASLHKLGSAPSYLRRNGTVSRITGGSLPAGLETDRETTPDTTEFTLSQGDVLLLVTDGVTDGTGDGWLRTMLSRYGGNRPRELAQAVLSSPGAGREDDRTVIAVQVGRRV